MSQDEDPVHRALIILEEIESMIKIAFGPDNKAVLIHQPAGQVMVTCGGMEILNSVLNERDPLTKIILESARKVEHLIGDGVKSFLFILFDLLRGCSRLQGRSRLASQLLSVQAHLASVGDVAFVQNCYVTQTKNEHRLEISEVCRRVIETFFKSKFPSAVSSTLSRIVCMVIAEYLNDFKHFWWDDLRLFLNNFNLLSLQVTLQSVEDSRVISGFLLSRKFAVGLKKEADIKIVVWKGRCGTEVSNSGERKAVLHVSDTDILNSAATVESSYYSTFLDSLVDHGVDLVISTMIVSDLVVFLCRKRGLALIHGVPVEEADYLCQVANLTPLVDLREACGSENVTTISRATSYILGTNCYTLLSISHVIQLIVCGPTQELCGQYYNACKNSLKLLQQWLSHSDESQSVGVSAPAGGYVECQLNQFLVSGKLTSTVDDDIMLTVAESVLGVPRRLYGRHSARNFLLHKQKSSANILEEKMSDSLEPVRVRVAIVHHVLGTCALLLRLTGVHKIKSKPTKAFVCRNDTDESDDDDEIN